MPRFLSVAVLLFCLEVAAQTPAATVALLVDEDDAARVAEGVEAALRGGDPLARAAAARVAAVRDLTATVPLLRETANRETDTTALREELRALALLGSEEDVDFAISIAAKHPPEMDAAVAFGVSRRAAASPVDLYLTKIRPLRSIAGQNFFLQALWNRPELVGTTAGRLLDAKDERGWRQLLGALASSGAALGGEHAARAMSADSEEIRVATVWFLVRGYAPDPAKVPEQVRAALGAEGNEQHSDREAFGRELLRRLLGNPPRESERWTRWLATNEADALLGRNEILFTYFTPAEMAVRSGRCKELPAECPVEPGRKRIPSQTVAAPDFVLPAVLPPGLADAVMRATRCRSDWLGVATATVDRAGRIRELDLSNVETSCQKTLRAILKLSYASNESLRSSFRSSNVLLVHAGGQPLCLDEHPSEHGSLRVGDDVTPPTVVRRVEPQFPATARQQMGSGTEVLVMVESVISREGCVRAVKLVRQSPFPALNGAAVMALSKWKFKPGRFGGEPVDVIFFLTVNFKIP